MVILNLTFFSSLLSLFKEERWAKNGSGISVRENCGSFLYVVSLNLKAINGAEHNLENTTVVEGNASISMSELC